MQGIVYDPDKFSNTPKTRLRLYKEEKTNRRFHALPHPQEFPQTKAIRKRPRIQPEVALAASGPSMATEECQALSYKAAVTTLKVAVA